MPRRTRQLPEPRRASRLVTKRPTFGSSIEKAERAPHIIDARIEAVRRLQSWLSQVAPRDEPALCRVLADAIGRARQIRRHCQGFAAACEIIRHSDEERLNRREVMRWSSMPRPTPLARFLCAAPAAAPRRSPGLWVGAIAGRVRRATSAEKAPKAFCDKMM